MKDVNQQQSQMAVTSLFRILGASLGFLLASCGGDDDPAPTSESDCLTTATWEPNIDGATSENHDSDVSVETEVLTGSGSIKGLGDPVDTSEEIEVTFEVDDLGTNGSFTLTAETENFPSGLIGGAYPALVYLSDGTNDLVNMSRTGSSDCVDEGYFSCSGGLCSSNSSCAPGATSAYFDRDDWEQFQIPAFGYATTNTFPSCNWSSGSPSCDFNSTFFSGGKLRTGTYTARYVLLASDYSSVSDETADLKVTVTKKSDSTAVSSSDNGALDLNIILVGDDNVNASHTTKGQANLNALMNMVFDIYNQSGTGVTLGDVRAFEWTCPSSGASFSTVDLEDLADLFEQGSSYIESSREGESLNIFLVNRVTYDTAGVTVLGVAGAIRGPMVNATGGSGLVFASFGELDTYNPDCADDDEECPDSSLESSFVDMGATIAHEMGHYLGLNHPTEADNSSDDNVPDTPECRTENQVFGGSSPDYLTHDSCLGETPCSTSCSSYDGSSTFCPTDTNCQFNHVMWYTSKNYSESSDTGDGNLFSSDSSVVINYNPFVR